MKKCLSISILNIFFCENITINIIKCLISPILMRIPLIMWAMS